MTRWWRERRRKGMRRRPGAAGAGAVGDLQMTERSDNDPLHAAINAKLAEIAASASTPPPWCAAWARLGPASSEAERLAVYRAVRDAGSVPAEAGIFLGSWQIDAITLGHAEQALRGYEERLEQIRRAHGLGDDDSWPPGEGPPEYEEAQRQMHDAWDALYVAQLEAFGETEMARLFRTDRERFEQLSEAGRQFFHGPDPADDDENPDWLDDLLDTVAGCVEADSPMGPLGLRYREEDGFWEISVCPTAVELVGGAHDGEVVAPGFSLDLEQLRAAFASVAAFGWNALGLNCPEGPYVSVEGVYQGRQVYLQVLAYAPEDEAPGAKRDTTRRPRKPEGT